MTQFQKIQQLHDDYISTKAVFDECQENLKSIISATSDRIENEKAEAVAKINRYKNQAEDSSRPETVRRLAAGELEKLKQLTFSATQEERNAFGQQIEAARVAIADMRQIEIDMRDTIREVEKEIASIRKIVCGDSSIDLRPRWIDKEKSRFDSLCQEVDLL